MDRTVDFYTRVLGMPLTATLDLPEGWKHFFFDMGGGSQLAFFSPPNIAKGTRTPPNIAKGTRTARFSSAADGTALSGGMDHVAFTVEDLAALSRAREELLEKGIEVTDITDHEFCKSIYFKDPDGIQLEYCAWVRPLREDDVQERYRAPRAQGA